MSGNNGFRVIHSDDDSVVERNKNLLFRFQEEVFDGHDWSRETLLKHLSPDFIDHNLHRGELPGLEGFRGRFIAWQNAFSNARQENLALVGEGELVAVLYDTHGRHSGDYMGVGPSNRDVTIPGIDFYRFKDGKITDRWGIYDYLTTALQIGANLMLAPLSGSPGRDYDTTRDTYRAREYINLESGEGIVKKNKDALHGFQEEVFNANDWRIETLSKFLKDDIIDHNSTPWDPPGLEGVRSRFSVWQSAFSVKPPETTLQAVENMAPEEEFAMAGEDDILAVAYDLHAWQTGPFMGVEATNNKVTIPGIEFLRFDEDHMIAEHWGIYDFMSTAEQIGAELTMTPRVTSMGPDAEEDSARLSN